MFSWCCWCHGPFVALFGQSLPGLVVVIQFDVGTWCENCTLLLVPYRQRVEDSAPFFVVFFLRRDLQTKLSLIVIPVKLHTGEAVT